MKKCECIKLVNESLRESYPDARLETGISFPEMQEMLYINFTYQPTTNKKRKTQVVVATYCPFCGKKM